MFLFLINLNEGFFKKRRSKYETEMFIYDILYYTDYQNNTEGVGCTVNYPNGNTFDFKRDMGIETSK